MSHKISLDPLQNECFEASDSYYRDFSFLFRKPHLIYFGFY